MDVDYKLFRQAGGRGSFAHVYVRVTNWDKQSKQVSFLEAVKEYATNWLDSAIDGCFDGLNALKQIGVKLESSQVLVTQIITTDVDTTSNAVYLSAFLATVKAFDSLEKFELTFDKDWKILFN